MEIIIEDEIVGYFFVNINRNGWVVLVVRKIIYKVWCFSLFIEIVLKIKFRRILY